MKKILLSAATLILVACNSPSPAQEDSTKHNFTNTTNSGTNNSATTGGSTNDNQNNKESTGGAFVALDDDTGVKYQEQFDASNLNYIVLDGKPVKVAYKGEGISSGSWTRINNVAYCCGTLNSMIFGYMDSTNELQDDVVFYNGTPSKSIPTTGVAQYKGAFVVTDEYDRTEADYSQGVANLTVDFANKNVTGTLDQATGVAPISINAKIDGTNIKGEASSVGYATKADLQGKFFGENGKEIGGIFKDQQNTWMGSFGVAKQ